MEITYLGHACFRLRGREGIVITDPLPRKSNTPSSRLSAEVVTVSHQDPSHNSIATVGGQPRVISGPGEYEVAGIMIVGIGTFHDSERGKKHGRNTAYVIDLDDIVVCHLGGIGHVPTSEQLSYLRNVDVLLVPVGGDVTIDAAQAVEVISVVEPKIVIPMHYRIGETDQSLEPLDRFLRETGMVGAEPQQRLTIAKSALPDSAQVIVLEPRSS